MATSVIKRYYDALGQGSLVAAKCQRCEGLTFPPTTACEHCGSDQVAWTQLTGRGTLQYLSHGAVPPPSPRYEEMAPYCFGHILLEEGVYVQAIVTNVEPTASVLAEYFERGPVEVVAEPITVGGLPVLAFKTV